MNVLGLDISTTSTGYCLPDGTADRIAPKHADSFERARIMRDEILPIFNAHRIDFVMKEAIGTSMVWTAISIAKAHALIEDELVRRGIPFLEIAPNTLKKFATGSGDSKTSKSQMTMAAARCGYEGDGQEDAVDAWWVWVVGNALNGVWLVPETEYRLDILVGLRKTPDEKKAEKKIAKQARDQKAADRAVKAAEKLRLKEAKAA